MKSSLSNRFKDFTHLAGETRKSCGRQGVVSCERLQQYQGSGVAHVPLQNHIWRIDNPVLGNAVFGVELKLGYSITSHVRGTRRQNLNDYGRRSLQSIVAND